MLLALGNERWINQTGLNLIRIVIGSYFMAVSLDLVVGVDHKVMFEPFLGPEISDLVGSTLLFFASALFMTGISLRLTSIFLAVYVLSSSIIQNFIHFHPDNVSEFWRDLTLACAVMLNYSSLGRREMRRASVLGRRAHIRRMRDGQNVVPRRVTLSNAPRRPSHYALLEPQSQILQRTRREQPKVKADDAKPAEKANTKAELSLAEDEPENIFANV